MEEEIDSLEVHTSSDLEWLNTDGGRFQVERGTCGEPLYTSSSCTLLSKPQHIRTRALSTMIIRDAQFGHIQMAFIRRFESSLLTLLREEFPHRTEAISDEDLLGIVDPAIQRAKAEYRIEGEDSLIKFVYLSWLLGEDFDLIPQHSWIQDILLHDRPCSERIEIIMSGVNYHLHHETETLRLAEDEDGEDLSV